MTSGTSKLLQLIEDGQVTAANAASHVERAGGASLVLLELFRELAAGAGGGPPTGGAGGALSGSYPNPGFAVDMATQAELDTVAASKANLAGGNTFTGNQLIPAGSFAAPALQVGGSLAGIYLSAAATGILSFRENSYNGFRFVNTDGNIIQVYIYAASAGVPAGLGISNNFVAGTNAVNRGAFALGYSGTLDTFVGRGDVAASIQMGVTAASTVDQLFKGPNGSGTNIAGGDLRLAPGQSTGFATPGALVLQGTLAGSSGTTVQPLTDVITIADSLNVYIADGVYIHTGDTSGTVFGAGATDKIGFWGTTPVVKPTADTTLGVASTGSGSGLLEDTTFDGGLGGDAYTLGGLVKRLKEMGLLT